MSFTTTQLTHTTATTHNLSPSSIDIYTYDFVVNEKKDYLVANKEILWLAYYIHSYSGYKRTGFIKPKQIQWDGVLQVFTDYKTGRVEYVANWKYVLLNSEADAYRYIDVQVKAHVEHLHIDMKKKMKEMKKALHLMRTKDKQLISDLSRYYHEEIRNIQE